MTNVPVKVLVADSEMFPLSCYFFFTPNGTTKEPLKVQSIHMRLLKKKTVFIQDPGSVDGKQTKWLGVSHSKLFQPISNMVCLCQCVMDVPLFVLWPWQCGSMNLGVGVGSGEGF